MSKPGSFIRDWAISNRLADLHNLRVDHRPQMTLIGKQFTWRCSCGARGRKVTYSEDEVDYGWWQHFRKKMDKLWAELEYP